MASFRYWRWWIVETSNGTDDQIILNSLHVASSAAGADLAFGTATATASSASGSGPPGNAIDNVSTSAWFSDSSAAFPQWIALDFGVAVDMYEYRIQSGIVTNHSSRMPRDWSVQYSSDGVNWRLAESRRDQAFGLVQTKTYVLGDLYIYWRPEHTRKNFKPLRRNQNASIRAMGI